MNNNLQLVLKSSTTEMSLNDHDAGIYIVPELDGLTGLPEIRTTSGVNAGYDGGWTSAQKFDARSIVIRGVIANEDKTEVERMRRELVALLAQGKNEQLELDFVTETGRAYEVQVRTIACDMAMQRVLTQQEFMITLRADDPLIYDNSSAGEEATVNVSGATGGFRIPFEIPLAIDAGSEETVVQNSGLESVAPTIKMYGALHNPKIINHTTNQAMQVEAELGFAEGDWIEPSDAVSGKDITINGAPEGAPLSSVQINGETSQQTYTGKNLLKYPYKDTTVTRNNVTFTVDSDGSITTSGTASAETLFWFTNDTWAYNTNNIVVPAGTYTINKTGKTYIAVYVTVYGETQGQIGTYNATISDTTFTVPEKSSLTVRLRVVSGANTGGFAYSPQIESGSSASPFEPYVGGIPAPNPDYPQAVQTVTGENVVKISDGQGNEQSYTVDLASKNLFDATNANTRTGYILNNSGVEVSDNTGGYTRNYSRVLPSTTYTISGLINAGTRRVYYYDQNKNFISRSDGSGASSWQFITPANCYFVNVQIYTNTDNSTSMASWQIEKGSSASQFEPYWAYELCKIGTYQDYIYKSGGKWKIHKEVGKETLNSTSHSGWQLTTSSDGYIRGDTVGEIGFPSNAGYCDKLVVRTGAHGAYEYIWFQPTNTGKIYIQILASRVSALTLAAFNTWIDSATPTIYYALATPTDTEITNAALIAQLEALAAATMYNPQTNITTLYAEGNEQPTLDVSYFTDKNPDTRDELVIDSRLRTITLNGLDVYHLQAPGSEFLMLAPGENKLSLQSDITGDNGYAKVSYKQGYLSI